jgi:hypothetical protein
MTLASLQRQRVFKIPIKIDVQNHHLEDKREGQRKAKKHMQPTRTKERRELVPSPTRTKETRKLVPLPQEPKKGES